VAEGTVVVVVVYEEGGTSLTSDSLDELDELDGDGESKTRGTDFFAFEPFLLI